MLLWSAILYLRGYLIILLEFSIGLRPSNSAGVNQGSRALLRLTADSPTSERCEWLKIDRQIPIKTDSSHQTGAEIVHDDLGRRK